MLFTPLISWGRFNHDSYPCIRCGKLLLVLAVFLSAISIPAWGQSSFPTEVVPGPVWSIVSEDGITSISVPVAMRIDSVEAVTRDVLHDIQEKGYYLARLDSVSVDSLQVPYSVRMHVTQGPLVKISSVEVLGAIRFKNGELLQHLETRSGGVLSRDVLERDLDRLVAVYEAEGFPLAEIRIESVILNGGDEPGLDIQLVVEEGYQPSLHRIELIGAKRTRPALAARLAELRVGASLAGYDPGEIRQLLQDSGLFEQVGLPELAVEPDSGAVIRVRVKEAAPGNFDLVLGYQPAAGGRSGGLIGNGKLEMRNLFGGGRIFSIRLNRLPEQVSSLNARIVDPYFLGLPLRVEGRFEGLQQHSEYGKQGYTGEVGYRLGRWTEVNGSLSREVTRPGPSGVAIAGGKQLIPRADALFAGVGLRVRRLDDGINPSSGFLAVFSFEEGRKEQSFRQVIAGADTTQERTVLHQSRFRTQVRFYAPTFGRQVFVAGVEGAILASEAYDESDLFRFGGAATLRGYDEERFLGRLTGRILAEYRYRIDPTSYGYLFFDLGYVDRPALAEIDSLRGFYPGYGFGIQFGTNIGLVNASYAISPEDNGPMNGRVHVGLSFGL